jgi:hypothetical protein
MEDEPVGDLGSQFEAVKIGMKHDKNHGYMLTLAIHPNDCPEELFRDFIGQRYTIVAVRTNDQGEPVAAKGTEEGRLAVKQAATLCADEKFQGWLCFNGYADEVSEEAAAIAVRTYCGIASRSELKTNKEAQAKFVGLRDMFVAKVTRSSGWKKSI